MTQTAIPYHFLRGGTSRGPYFERADLPEDRETLAEALIAAVGAGHALNIDGVGGGATVTTKVAMLSPSEDDWAEIDYFFAQVDVKERLVDFKPTCGNILSGVGPAAIEMGLMPAKDGVTEVKIRAVNTGARILAKVRTPGGQVEYAGETAIDGVPGTASPIELAFMDVAGSVTGAFLPTGNPRDAIQGVEVTCMDVAMPVVIGRAEDFGLSGYESAEELDANRGFYERFEALRIEAGALMGLGDVTKSVTPKFAVLAPARAGGAVAARYFTPWSCHPSMAVTGAQCIASCVMTPGAIADGLFARPNAGPTTITLEHPLGRIDVLLDFASGSDGFEIRSAGLVRTARLLARGEIFVPRAVWSGHG